MKKYEKYKDSGIEWIGEIPEDWVINKFGRSAFFQEGPGLRNWQFTEEGTKVICVTNIVPPNIDFEVMTKYISNEEYDQSYKHFTVQKGDILLASSGASWGKVAEYTSDETVILNTSTIRLNENNQKNVTKSLIKWVIQSPYITENLNLLLTGSCQPNFGPTHLNKLTCVYPKLIQEQTAIANYLDHKTAQIDDLIAKKEKLIELLKEERTATINQAVTKGLDPNVKMKDSGIEWLGEMPESWSSGKLGYITTKIGDGLHGTPEYVEDSEYYFVNGNNIGSGKLVTNEQTKKVSEDEYQKNRKPLSDTSILMSINGTIGNLAFYNSEKVMLGKSIAYINCNKSVNKEFVLFFLMSSSNKYYINCELSGSTIANLSLYSLNKLPIALPCIEEQKAIVNYLIKEMDSIDNTIAKNTNQIALLKEYKTALISEVVTGKIDVRDEKIN